MKYNIFISYPGTSQDIVENLRGHFKNYGVTAWVYSIDQTLNEILWSEIETRINECDLMVFIVSENTLSAAGQLKELQLALDKIEPLSSADKIMPIFVNGANPAQAPVPLQHKTGPFLGARNVKNVALRVTKRAFPALLESKITEPWKFPVPGEWLKVIDLDDYISDYFDIDDKLYFRRISPMGLFECYAPKIKGLFWIAAENVSPSYDIEEDKDLESAMPTEFKYWH
jgi:hypothetical protein